MAVVIDVGKPAEEPVEQPRREALRCAVGAPAPARYYHVVALARPGVEPRDLLGPVLQVAVHHHHPVPVAVVESRGDAVVLAEIAAELDAFHPRVPAREALDDLPRAVAPAVLDHDDLEILRDARERGEKPAVELLEAALGAVDRRDDGEVGHDRGYRLLRELEGQHQPRP